MMRQNPLASVNVAFIHRIHWPVFGMGEMGDGLGPSPILPLAACAAFCKESRMKFANATKFDRKSGVA